MHYSNDTNNLNKTNGEWCCFWHSMIRPIMSNSHYRSLVVGVGSLCWLELLWIVRLIISAVFHILTGPWGCWQAEPTEISYCCSLTILLSHPFSEKFREECLGLSSYSLGPSLFKLDIIPIASTVKLLLHPRNIGLGWNSAGPNPTQLNLQLDEDWSQVFLVP